MKPILHIPQRPSFDRQRRVSGTFSLHKWESKWNKAFLTKREKTTEEIIDYVKCMTLTKNVNPEVYLCLTADNFKQIQNYIEAPMTATTFADDKQSKNSREVITSELIYYWMIAQNIPFECRKWHLNSLLTLIRVCNIKNAPYFSIQALSERCSISSALIVGSLMHDTAMSSVATRSVARLMFRLIYNVYFFVTLLISIIHIWADFGGTMPTYLLP